MSLKKILLKKTSNSIDQLIGKRIKMRRTMLNMTQSNLASHIDLSFQQLQKYESGSNRISAGLLYRLSKILQVDLDFFFSQEPRISLILAEESESYQGEKKRNNQLDKIIEFYMRLPNEESRRALLQFIQAIVDRNGGC